MSLVPPVPPVEPPVPAGHDDDDPEQVRAVGIEVFDDTFPMAQAYAGLLTGRATEWGLIGPREGGRIWSRHIFNSVAIAPLIAPGRKVADVGSGAGLPGLPLAIARPDLTVTLIESLQRRARFLQEVIAELGIGDRVDVEHRRAEECRRSFETVVSRAVAPLQTLIPWCLGLIKPPGEVLAMRGSHVSEEARDYLQQAPKLRHRVTVAVHPAPGSEHPIQIVRVTA